MPYKLGKKPARAVAVAFAFANYVDLSRFPKLPPAFGQPSLIPNWGMLGNDDFGCCVWASAAHATTYWNRLAGRKVQFTTQNVLSDYAAVTGFDPKKPDTDQGTDMAAAAEYRRKTGIIDSNGQRHKVGAYLALRPGDLDQLNVAIFLFRAVDIGLVLRNDADSQFDANKAWEVTPHSRVDGGHCVSGSAKHADGNYVVQTWGRDQIMTPGYYLQCSDEATAYVAQDMLDDMGTVRGFNMDRLRADLAALGS